jgi:hypothetical protein
MTMERKVKIQQQKNGQFAVTIPKEIAMSLKIEKQQEAHWILLESNVNICFLELNKENI